MRVFTAQALRPNIDKYKYFTIDLENQGSTDVSLTLFDLTNTTYTPTTAYKMVAPYAASYSLGTKWWFKVNSVTVNGTLASIQTPAQFAATLTAQGYGTWLCYSDATNGNVFFCYTNTNTIVNLRIDANTYTAIVVTTIGNTAIVVRSPYLNKILNSQAGCYYQLNYGIIWSSSTDQVLEPIEVNYLQADGLTNGFCIAPLLPPNQIVNTTYVDFHGFQLNTISNVQFTLLANTEINMKFFYDEWEYEGLLTKFDDDPKWGTKYIIFEPEEIIYNMINKLEKEHGKN